MIDHREHGDGLGLALSAHIIELVHEGLAQGHHAGRGEGEAVLVVAEAHVVARVLADRSNLTGDEAKLIAVRAIATTLYLDEQELVGKVDALEDRIADLRTALTSILSATSGAYVIARAALDEDDEAKGEPAEEGRASA